MRILGPNQIEGDMLHLCMTMDENGVSMEMQLMGLRFRTGNTVIVEEFVASAFVIGMSLDEIRDSCYAHGFDIIDVGPVKDIFVRLEMLYKW